MPLRPSIVWASSRVVERYFGIMSCDNLIISNDEYETHPNIWEITGQRAYLLNSYSNLWNPHHARATSFFLKISSLIWWKWKELWGFQLKFICNLLHQPFHFWEKIIHFSRFVGSKLLGFHLDVKKYHDVGRFPTLNPSWWSPRNHLSRWIFRYYIELVPSRERENISHLGKLGKSSTQKLPE